MKRFLVYFLVVAMAMMLTSCVSTPTNGSQTDVPVDGDVQSGAVAGESDAANGASIDDILEGLSYELVCLDGESDLGDDGRLNDGVYRTEDELQAGSNTDAVVTLAGGIHRYQITFDTDGLRLAQKLVFHNVLGNETTLTIDAVELGESVDTLAEIAFDTQTAATVSEYADVSATFDAVTVDVLRVTFSSDADTFSLEELTLIATSGAASSETKADPTTTTAFNAAASLVGTWIGQDPEYPDSDVVLVFNADNTGSYSQEGLDVGFSWTTDGHNVTMKLEMFGTTKNGTYDVVSDLLVLPDEEGNNTVFTRLG